MIVLWLFFAAALLFFTQRWLYSAFWARKLELRVEFDRPTAEAGENVVMTETTVNRKLMPLPMLRYHYSLQRNFELYRAKGEQPIRVSRRLAVPGRHSVRCTTTLHGLRRGVYTLAEMELLGQDLFYTLEERRSVQSPARLTVYPEKLSMQQLSVPYRELLGAVLTRRSAQEDPFEIRNIRPYEIYDSMRMINWKASARTGELKVNQHDFTTDEALCLIVDAEHGSVEERERVISAASALAALFLRRGVTVSLVANGRSCIGGREIRVAAGAGAAHLRVIDDSLAQLKLGAAPTRTMEALLEALRDERLNALCALLSAGNSPGLSRAFDALCGTDRGFFLAVGQGEASGSCFTTLLLDAAEQEAAS